MEMNTNVSYRKSRHLVFVEGENDKTIIYHSLFNNPHIVEKPLLDFLNFFSAPRTLEDLLEVYDSDVMSVFLEFSQINFLVEEGKIERATLQRKQTPFLESVKSGAQLAKLELSISDACNLGCAHCMHFNNNEFDGRTSSSLHMTAATAKKSIDTFVSEVRKSGNSNVRIHFGNGEPLLNWKAICFCLEYCTSLSGLNVSFSINTNLTVLTREMAETLKFYDVKVSTSLDGLKGGNDAIRVDLKGEGTFDRIVDKIRLLNEVGHPIKGFTITVTDKNFYQIDTSVIDFAKEIGLKDISMDCDLVSSTAIPVDEFVEKIILLRRYANNSGLNFYGTWETPYRGLMAESWLTKPYSFCPAMEGKTLSFGVDGSLKTCGHTNTKIGHINNFVQIKRDSSSFVDLIESRLPGNNQMCIGCEIEGSCGGQCHVTIESSKRDNNLMEKMCDFMRKTTRALLHEELAVKS